MLTTEPFLQHAAAGRSPKSASGQAAGHIDAAIRGADGSLTVAGWSLPYDATDIVLTGDGNQTWSMAHAHPVHRPDLAEVFGALHGAGAQRGGFITRIENAGRAKWVSLRLGRGRGKILSTAATDAGVSDPVVLAKRLFSVPTPQHKLVARFAEIDGPQIAASLRARNDALAALAVERQNFGEPPVRPETSIVVPLYGRWDFIEHQLLAFAHDSGLRNDVELIYVLDDPDLVEPVTAASEELFRVYGVPFSLVWGHANRGFSGASNLGASQAAGRFLIFLNSDVFPKAPGWVEGLTGLLKARPEFGVVAPRLLFPDGGLQHAGIAFRWNSTLGTWINDHPLMGLPPSADTTRGLVERPAVTGACMAVRRHEFEALGGFDTGYLIGDFEDSDLCLKYRQKGLLPGYTPDVELIHLERQSLNGIGDAGFRQQVVVLNALRHYRRWGNAIERLADGPILAAAQ
ncbi:glycosyltransferase [Cucumibacter marinus]|uniref:glycosyltransferase n=1 Tax=Cucumibacter marinus TaxID=1121252 RepID=UPI0003F85E0B|nr:glycosyltransferase [Cucumibacter marinus]